MGAESTLETVWALVAEHVRRDRNAASSPEVKALRSEQKKISAKAVPGAIEAWIARHGAALTVRRGVSEGAASRVADAVGPLHPLHRTLIEHFGFLEIRIALSHWPYARHTDGLRILGWCEEDPWCHAPRMAQLHRAYFAKRNEEVRGEDKEAAANLELTPMLTSLEGLRDQWAGSGKKVKWIKEGNRDNVFELDSTGCSDPRFGAAYALLARLRIFELRLANIARARALHAMCNAITPTDFDDHGYLFVRGDPQIRLRPSVHRFGGAHGVLARRVLEDRPEGLAFKTDAVQAARAAALAKRVSRVRVLHSGQTVSAEANLPLDAGPELVASSIAALRHVSKMWDDPTLPGLDA